MDLSTWHELWLVDVWLLRQLWCWLAGCNENNVIRSLRLRRTGKAQWHPASGPKQVCPNHDNFVVELAKAPAAVGIFSKIHYEPTRKLDVDAALGSWMAKSSLRGGRVLFFAPEDRVVRGTQDLGTLDFLGKILADSFAPGKIPATICNDWFAGSTNIHSFVGEMSCP